MPLKSFQSCRGIFFLQWSKVEDNARISKRFGRVRLRSLQRTACRKSAGRRSNSCFSWLSHPSIHPGCLSEALWFLFLKAVQCIRSRRDRNDICAAAAAPRFCLQGLQFPFNSTSSVWNLASDEEGHPPPLVADGNPDD